MSQTQINRLKEATNNFTSVSPSAERAEKEMAAERFRNIYVSVESDGAAQRFPQQMEDLKAQFMSHAKKLHVRQHIN